MSELQELNSSEAEEGQIYRRRTLSMHRNQRRRSGSSKSQYSDISYTAVLTQVPIPEHVDHIVEKMVMDDEEILEDNQQADWNRTEALRLMPQSLTMKRLIKRRLGNKVHNYKGKNRISMMQQNQYSLNMFFKKSKIRFYNFLFKFELWYSTMKRIEGEFGSATAIFFKFFRYLFLLNTICLFTSFFPIIVPQLLYIFQSNVTNEENFHVSNIFMGDGFFTSTVLYFGFYTNSSVSLTNLSYSMPHGYFYTMLSTYLLVFVVLAVNMAQSYRKNFIETKGGLNNVYAQKVFANWDFSIATLDASRLKSSSIYHELQELLENDNLSVSRGCFKEFSLLMIRLSGNLLIISTMTGISYAIWILLDEHRTRGDVPYIEIATAVVINAFMYLIPMMFTLVSKYEDYKNPRTTFYLNLIRIFLLQIAIFGVLIAFWVIKAPQIECWETSLGQEIYRLLIFDFIFYALSLILWEFSKYLINKYELLNCNAPEFEISRHTLQLTYNQTLFWLGLYFAPLLSVLIFIKYLINWYLITCTLLVCCRPSAKSWRAAHTQTWFLIVVFISLLGVIGVLGYTIASIPVSNCGPFMGYTYVYDIIKEGVYNLEQGDLFWKVLIYATKPGVVAIILIALCCIIYTLREKAKVQEMIVQEIRHMLTMETRDKEYLLNKLHSYTKEVDQELMHGENQDPRDALPGRYFVRQQVQTDPGNIPVDRYPDLTSQSTDTD